MSSSDQKLARQIQKTYGVKYTYALKIVREQRTVAAEIRGLHLDKTYTELIRETTAAFLKQAEEAGLLKKVIDGEAREASHSVPARRRSRRPG